jgi:hypothetical protein
VIPSREGRWSLRAHDARTGVLVLDDGAVLPLLRNGDGLQVERDMLVASGARALADQDAHLKAAGLPALALPAALAKLVRVCWQKANDLQTPFEPRFFTLGDDGRYRVTQAGTNCIEDGLYAFDAQSSETQLSMLTDHACRVDMRDNPTTVRFKPDFFEDFLVLDDAAGTFWSHARTYRRAGSAASSTFVERGADLEVVGRYQGHPVAGVPFALRLSLRGSGSERFRVTRVTVGSQPFALVGDRLQEAGQFGTLDDQVLDVSLAPGTEHLFESTLTFPAGPFVRLDIDIQTDGHDGRPLFYYVNPTRLKFVLAVEPAP